MSTLLWVMAGGAIGTGLRYGVGTLLPSRSGEFPTATLLVNLLGCLLIGFVATWLNGNSDAKPMIRLAIVVGCLGGFTTFSSFAFETLSLFQSGRWASAILYVGLSNILGIVFAGTGWWLATISVTKY